MVLKKTAVRDRVAVVFAVQWRSGNTDFLDDETPG